MRPALLVLAAGCRIGGVSLGYPRADLDDTGGPVFDTGVVCAPEVEPNDFDEDDDYSWLGLVQDDRAPQACGRLSSTGTDYYGYFDGDYDYYAVEAITSGTVRAEVSWSGDADLDVVLFAGEDQWGDYDQDDDVAVVERNVDEGFYLVLVLGASGPATDYVLTVSR